MSRIPGGVSPFSSISSTRRYDVGCGGSECAAEEDAVAASSDGFGDGRSTAEPPGGGPAGVASTRRGVVFNGAADPASDPTAYLGVAVVGGTRVRPVQVIVRVASRARASSPGEGCASSMDRIAASSRRTDAASDSPTTLPGGVPATGAAARRIIIDPVLSRYPPPPREDGDARAPPPPGAPLALALALRSATAAATASRISSRARARRIPRRG